jgi:dihydroorotate dehydrogenase
MSDFSVRQTLDFRTPWLNAAGSLGFSPPGQWRWGEPMGVFVTNPISLFPRTPAEERAAILFPGGFLLHTGLPNPGLKGLLAGVRRWRRDAGDLPVWVHIFGDNVSEIEQLVRSLENLENVSAIELGLNSGVDAGLALLLVRSALGELPLVVNIPLTCAAEAWVDKLTDLGASAISLAPPRGWLPGANGKLVGGRLYGPAMLPLALAAVRSLKRQSLPVIASGGVYRKADGEALLAAGAAAVQLDSVLWL